MQYEILKGGRHRGQMKAQYFQMINELREKVDYDEHKTILRAYAPKDAERIINIIEKETVFTCERSCLIKKAINAILAGEDLSKVKSIEEIELASLNATFVRHFKTSDDLSCVFRKQDIKSELEKYSTSQLKAELRRRKGK